MVAVRDGQRDRQVGQAQPGDGRSQAPNRSFGSRPADSGRRRNGAVRRSSRPGRRPPTAAGRSDCARASSRSSVAVRPSCGRSSRSTMLRTIWTPAAVHHSHDFCVVNVPLRYRLTPPVHAGRLAAPPQLVWVRPSHAIPRPRTTSATTRKLEPETRCHPGHPASNRQMTSSDRRAAAQTFGADDLDRPAELGEAEFARALDLHAVGTDHRDLALGQDRCAVLLDPDVERVVGAPLAVRRDVRERLRRRQVNELPLVDGLDADVAEGGRIPDGLEGPGDVRDALLEVRPHPLRPMILADPRVDGPADHDHVQLGRLLLRSRLQVHAQIAIGQIQRHRRVDLLGLRVEGGRRLHRLDDVQDQGLGRECGDHRVGVFGAQVDGRSRGRRRAARWQAPASVARHLNRRPPRARTPRRARRERERSSETSERACSGPTRPSKVLSGRSGPLNRAATAPPRSSRP